MKVVTMSCVALVSLLYFVDTRSSEVNQLSQIDVFDHQARLQRRLDLFNELTKQLAQSRKDFESNDRPLITDTEKIEYHRLKEQVCQLQQQYRRFTHQNGHELVALERDLLLPQRQYQGFEQRIVELRKLYQEQQQIDRFIYTAQCRIIQLKTLAEEQKQRYQESVKIPVFIEQRRAWLDQRSSLENDAGAHGFKVFTVDGFNYNLCSKESYLETRIKASIENNKRRQRS